MKKILLLLSFSLLLIACKKKTIWETEWSAPVINDTLSLVNLVNDSTLAEVGGFYELQMSRTLFDMNIDEFVDIPDTTIEEEFTISVLNLTLAPGFSFINSTEEHDFDIPGAELQTIILKEGYIDVEVRNPVGTNAFFNVTLPGATKDGVVFSEQYMAPPGSNSNPGVFNATIDLSDYTIDLSGVSGADHNKFTSQITVSSDPNGPTVTITNQDVTVVAATFRDIKIGYAQGYFGNQVISDTTDFSFEELNIYGGGLIDFPGTSISLEIENGIKVSGQGTLNTMTNENSMGNVVNLTGAQMGSTFNLDPAMGNWGTLAPSMKTITFDNANSNIESYLENLGYKHQLAYKIELNPWGNVNGGWDQLFPHSKFRLKLNANMPLNIGADQLVVRDTFEVELVQNPEKTKVVSGELILNASNAFPFSALVGLEFINTSGVVIHTIAASDIIQSSQFGSLDTDINLLVMDSEVKIVLPKEVVEDLKDIKEIVVQAEFNTINPSTGLSEQMPIPVGAFMAVKLRTNFVTENIF